jgi:hypothetical protein
MSNNVLQFTAPARTSGGALTAPPPLPQTSVDPAQQGAAQPPMPTMPAPTHAETVTALRHFMACMRVEKKWLDSPELGKADMRNVFIDGYTKLVADRIATPTQAVTTLATTPDLPRDQKKWVMDNYQRNMQARDLIIAHHAAAFAGVGPQDPPDKDDHLSLIGSMMKSNYPGKAS